MKKMPRPKDEADKMDMADMANEPKHVPEAAAAAGAAAAPKKRGSERSMAPWARSWLPELLLCAMRATAMAMTSGQCCRARQVHLQGGAGKDMIGLSLLSLPPESQMWYLM